MNEHKALISMIDRSNIPGKVIVLMDRGYESYHWAILPARQENGLFTARGFCPIDPI